MKKIFTTIIAFRAQLILVKLLNWYFITDPKARQYYEMANVMAEPRRAKAMDYATNDKGKFVLNLKPNATLPSH
jgi:hypothetical protein